jgi:hypothetical protein
MSGVNILTTKGVQKWQDILGTKQKTEKNMLPFIEQDALMAKKSMMLSGLAG